MVTVFIGNIAHCISLGELECFRGYIAVKDNKILSVGDVTDVNEIARNLNSTTLPRVKQLTDSQLLIPGFIDGHVHAPQFPNIGMGLDKPLLEWLKAYTFPLEKQYGDLDFATNVYNTVVSRTLKNGTTTASYYGSLHLESSIMLAQIASRYGQRALVGKVSMNIPNDDGYFNSTAKDIDEAEKFIIAVKNLKDDIVEPVITPRFALSCDNELMKKLSELAIKHDCKIQTHVSENKGEIEAVGEMYPEATTYCDVYDKVALLQKCILAHGIHLQDSEISLIVDKNCSVIHCPASNTRLMSGLCPVRKLIDRGVTVGLGTDVSGGDSSSILDSLRRCMDVSQHLVICEGKPTPPISWKEAFYLATLGGAKALFLDHKIGNFKVGKELDALVIDLSSPNSPIDVYSVPREVKSHNFTTDSMKVLNLLQRFVYLGNSSNIIGVIVKGKELSL